MQFVDYGSFLTKEKKNQAVYEHSKPLFKLAFLAFLAFSLGSFLAMGASYAYVFHTKPVPVVSVEEYNKAHKLSLNVNKAIAVVKNARPKGIDAVEAVGIIADAASSLNGKVFLVDISITPEDYFIKGTASDIKYCDAYLKALNFSAVKFTKELSDVKAAEPKKGEASSSKVDFTVKVHSNQVAAGAQKGVNG